MEQINDIIQKIPEQVRYVIVAGVAVLMVALYVFLVRFPAQDRLAQLNREFQEVNKTYQSKKAIADDLQTWQLEVQRLQVTLEEALNQLPNEVDTDQLLISVPNIAKKNALEVREFSVESERNKGTYAEVPMQLALVGTYKGIGGFAQEIGDQPRIMAVQGLSLKKDKAAVPSSSSREGDETEGIQLQIDAEVVTYRFLGK